MPHRFSTLLVANRGEIARRILRTARCLGLRSVAVYSDADAEQPHLREADTAIRIGPAAARESYLDGAAVIAAARQAGAQAIHPGYGFLSENAGFARACGEAGLIFVGPSPEAMQALGNKSAAKALAEQLGVPCLAGYRGAPEGAAAAAARIGFPVMIKAAAGGGGRGMRRVDRAEDLPAALEAAAREAQAGFGSGELLLERFVAEARHVEVQIIGDAQGHVVALGERDCSTQRRNQKLIEEAPAPGVDAGLRRRLFAAATTLGRAVNYAGAGTVEFLLEPDGNFAFLEVNARLQVEHPVTEMVTGLDLVELQLRVAQGESLQALVPAPPVARGHAIEARLCAEDADFVPQSGRIARWRPAAGEGLRIDHALEDGARVPPDYDSMIAKLIAWGETREDARRRLVAALRGTALFGLATNRDALAAALEAPDFAEARLATAWLGRARPAPAPLPSAWWALAAALLVAPHAARHGALAGWSSAGRLMHPLALAADGHVAALRIGGGRDGFAVEIGAARHTVTLSPGSGIDIAARLDGAPVAARAERIGGALWLDAFGRLARVEDRTQAPPRAKTGGGAGEIAATMHGRVTAVFKRAGDRVARGEAVLAIEAMKMEHRLAAAADGTVEDIAVSPGTQVTPGRVLARIKPG